MKKILITSMAVVLALGFTQLNAFAEKKHRMGHHDYQKMSMNDRFFMKVKMIKKHQEEIGVTDDQMHQIKDIKTALKKDTIRKQAEIDILKIDIRSLMHKEQVDVKAVYKLIDKKYENKKAKAKKAVESFAQLKKIITKDQMAKLRSIKKNKMKGHHMPKDYKKGKHHDSHKGAH
jgi:Spy/CpxP family protein refolding chaperone